MTRQMLGFPAFRLDLANEQLWRDSRLYRIAPITDEMVLNFIGERLGLPRSF
jgi:acyl-CoA dehydrogenase